MRCSGIFRIIYLLSLNSCAKEYHSRKNGPAFFYALLFLTEEYWGNYASRATVISTINSSSNYASVVFGTIKSCKACQRWLTRVHGMLFCSKMSSYRFKMDIIWLLLFQGAILLLWWLKLPHFSVSALFDMVKFPKNGVFSDEYIVALIALFLKVYSWCMLNLIIFAIVNLRI